MLKFFKEHWFGLLLGLFVLLYVTMILIVVSSPRQDKQNRGFIPCTKIMLDEIINCKDDDQYMCIGESILKNSACDAGVIINGFKDWTKGKQSRPWSNYFFTPELETPLDDPELDEELKEFYEQNPDVHLQMEQLNSDYEKLNKDMEESENEPELPQ